MRTKGRGEKGIDSMYMHDRDIVVAQLLGSLLVLCQIKRHGPLTFESNLGKSSRRLCIDTALGIHTSVAIVEGKLFTGEHGANSECGYRRMTALLTIDDARIPSIGELSSTAWEAVH